MMVVQFKKYVLKNQKNNRVTVAYLIDLFCKTENIKTFFG